MTRILVLGGASAVGSLLCERLLRRGYEVVAIDDLSSGTFANLAGLKDHRRFCFVEHDIAEPFRAEVDGIFHLALPSTRARCEVDGVRAVRTCVLGTLHALAVARSRGATLVFASSTERYGAGVRCAESVAHDDASAHGVDVRFVRLARSFGPRMEPSHEHPVSALVLAALHGVPLPALPQGRDNAFRLIFVDDAVEILARTMGCAVHTPPLLAPSIETTPGSLRDVVAKEAGLVAIGTPPSPPPTDVPWRMHALTTSLDGALPAALVLGPTECVSLARGVRQTLRWFAARMGHAHAGPPPSAKDTLGHGRDHAPSERPLPERPRPAM